MPKNLPLLPETARKNTDLSVKQNNVQALSQPSHQAPETVTKESESQAHGATTQQLDPGLFIPSSHSQDSNVYSLLHRQNQIIELLVQQQNSNSLPTREIPVYDGDPISNRAFIRAFQHCVGEKTKN